MPARHTDSPPGCGGCLLITVMLLLVLGGWQAVGGFISLLLFSGIFSFLLLTAALFVGLPWYFEKKAAAYERSQSESHNRFVHLLVNILMSIAKADGQFSRSELNTMLSFFQNALHYNQEQMYWVKQLIKEARDSQQDLDALLLEFRSSFAYEPRLILLELIYQIVCAKQPVLENELHLARKIGQFLQINAYERQTIENKYRWNSSQQQRDSPAGAAHAEKRCYTVLGLQEGADFAAIKKAYRTLSMQYHPDKVAHLGAEFKRVAEEKMKEINLAYDHFRKKFERP